jgi:hypothetical protein
MADPEGFVHFSKIKNWSDQCAKCWTKQVPPTSILSDAGYYAGVSLTSIKTISAEMSQ